MFTFIPEDVVTNTFHVLSQLTPTKEEVAAEMAPLFSAFYTTVYSSDRCANYMRPAAATLRVYDLDDPQPRVPVIVPLALTTVPLTASLLPNEVAAVLSFQGDRVSGIPQARRRGRVYIGGLASQAVASSSTSSYTQLSGTMTGGLRTAAQNLMEDSLLAGMPWCVWSPTTEDPVIVTNGWVDSSPDTQRRRGVGATIRTLFPA